MHACARLLSCGSSSPGALWQLIVECTLTPYDYFKASPAWTENFILNFVLKQSRMAQGQHQLLRQRRAQRRRPSPSATRTLTWRPFSQQGPATMPSSALQIPARASDALSLSVHQACQQRQQLQLVAAACLCPDQQQVVCCRAHLHCSIQQQWPVFAASMVLQDVTDPETAKICVSAIAAVLHSHAFRVRAHSRI